VFYKVAPRLRNTNPRRAALGTGPGELPRRGGERPGEHRRGPRRSRGIGPWAPSCNATRLRS